MIRKQKDGVKINFSILCTIGNSDWSADDFYDSDDDQLLGTLQPQKEDQSVAIFSTDSADCDQ